MSIVTDFLELKRLELKQKELRNMGTPMDSPYRLKQALGGLNAFGQQDPNCVKSAGFPASRHSEYTAASTF